MSSGGSDFYKDDKASSWHNHVFDESGCVIGEAPSQGFFCSLDAEIEKAKKANGYITRDSGKRHEEPTGAKRDTNEGKGRFDLIAPVPLKRLAQLYQRGSAKYGDRNWEKGIRLSRYLDSALRHINDYLAGDRVEDHIIAAAWNCFGFVATEDAINTGKLPLELNDLPPIKLEELK